MKFYSDFQKLVFLQINFDFVGFTNATEDRAKYNRIINQCINIDLMKSHNLSGFSSIEYCTHEENLVDIGKQFRDSRECFELT